MSGLTLIKVKLFYPKFEDIDFYEFNDRICYIVDLKEFDFSSACRRKII